MSNKRPLTSANTPNGKRCRKSLALNTKLEVIRRFEEGQRAVDIGVALGLAPTTVRTIRGNAEKIKKSIQNVTSVNATKISRSRSDTMEQMEQLLAVWIENQVQKHMPLSLGVIQAKAKKLFEELKQNVDGNEETFTASRG